MWTHGTGVFVGKDFHRVDRDCSLWELLQVVIAVDLKPQPFVIGVIQARSKRGALKENFEHESYQNVYDFLSKRIMSHSVCDMLT